MGERQVQARQVVIATGSRPALSEAFRARGNWWLDDVFAWDTLPRRVAVCGPGVIGLELGQALARLGVAGVWRAGRVSDPAIRDYAKPAFQQEFYLDPNARAQEMQREGNQVLPLLRDATSQLAARYCAILQRFQRTINRGAGRLRNPPPDKMGALFQRGGFSATSAPDSLNKSASCAAFLCSPTSRPAS